MKNLHTHLLLPLSAENIYLKTVSTLSPSQLFLRTRILCVTTSCPLRPPTPFPHPQTAFAAMVISNLSWWLLCTFLTNSVSFLASFMPWILLSADSHNHMSENLSTLAPFLLCCIYLKNITTKFCPTCCFLNASTHPDVWEKLQITIKGFTSSL
jgi:hypothetical protein